MNSGFPFSAYGESFFMAVQTMFIAYLICKYSGKTGTGILLNLLYSALLYVFISGFLTVEQLGYLQMTNVPLIVVSRLIQVNIFSKLTISNFSQKSSRKKLKPMKRIFPIISVFLIVEKMRI